MPQFKPQSEFPLIERYREQFAVNEYTVFAYNGVIYTNNDLPEHLIIHEETHLKQQREHRFGVAGWVEDYLNDNVFRLKVEAQAYRNQLASVKDRNNRNYLKIQCARDLAGPLYGNLLSYNEAFKLI